MTCDMKCLFGKAFTHFQGVLGSFLLREDGSSGRVEDPDDVDEAHASDEEVEDPIPELVLGQ
jgi:hypothetical protein